MQGNDCFLIEYDYRVEPLDNLSQSQEQAVQRMPVADMSLFMRYDELPEIVRSHIPVVDKNVPEKGKGGNGIFQFHQGILPEFLFVTFPDHADKPEKIETVSYHKHQYPGKIQQRNQKKQGYPVLNAGNRVIR